MAATKDIQSRKPLSLAVLISGGGRTMQNLADHIAGHSGQRPLNAKMDLVISSGPEAAGLEKAARIGVPVHVVERTKHPDAETFSDAVFELVRRADVDLICFAGWLHLLRIPPGYAGRVINIHPALLPNFGGTGMYGKRVHQAVLDAGCKVSGCTVHFADQTYDTGPIIVQRCCPVLEDDTPATLAARVFELECIAYPQAIDLIGAGRVRIEGRRTQIRPEPEKAT